MRQSSNIPTAIVMFVMFAIIAYFLYEGMAQHSLASTIP
jgi:hypothetical protein